MSAELETVGSEALWEDGGRLGLRVWLRLLTCSSLVEARVRKGLREEFETTPPRFDLLSQIYRFHGG